MTLAYFAGLLSGRRNIKKFLVLTDQRAGDNGKTAFFHLMRDFFSAYAKVSATFVCKASVERGRDEHNSGIDKMFGKRLLVGDEMSSKMTLDDALVKNYTGGQNVVVEGRKFGSDTCFRFVWQAGIVLNFNVGCCPQFDTADQAFTQRMLVVPMRSKFVAFLPEDNVDEHTFVRDTNVTQAFPSWMSALADVLCERFVGAEDCIQRLPPAMQGWRQDITSAANPMAQWLDSRVDITGDPADIVTFAELRALYSGPVPDTVAKYWRAYFVELTHLGVKYLKNTTIEGHHGKRTGTKDVVRGVSLRVGTRHPDNPTT